MSQSDKDIKLTLFLDQYKDRLTQWAAGHKRTPAPLPIVWDESVNEWHWLNRVQIRQLAKLRRKKYKKS